MQRLSLALAAAALVVAFLGATSLGEAARKAVAGSVRSAVALKPGSAHKASASESRGPRGPRGRRGRRGPRGLRGFQGPPGDKGDKGDPGASDGFEVRSTATVTITGTTRETANVVLNLPAVPVGNYLFTAQLNVEGSGEGTVVCEALAPGLAGTYSSTAKARVGSTAGAARAASLAIVFGAALTNGGTAHVRCWEEDGTLNDPSVTAAELVAVRTSTLTRT